MDKRLAKKVLVIGWDAADWKVINPLLDVGAMPALNSMINEGVIGNIATLHPAISPILWNSIATGKLPEKHGIFGFTEPVPDGSGIRQVSSTSRKAKAVWDILKQAGFRSHIVNWFASHPAECVNGVCVSNHFFSTPRATMDQMWPVPSQSVHPVSMSDALADFRMHPFEIEGVHILPFIPRGAELDQRHPENQHALTVLRKHLAECASVHAVATHLMEHEPWDFMAVYYNAIDLLGHYFMPFHPPRLDWVDEQKFSLFKDVINGVYQFHDRMLARLLQLAGENTTVILLSDHGFHSDHLRPRVAPGEKEDPTAWHRSLGILAMKGQAFLKDERVYGSSLLDITPTILSLFGLPIGADMDGKVLVQAFRSTPDIRQIPSWETVPDDRGKRSSETPVDPQAAIEAIKQLVDLGYIQKPYADVQKTIQRTLDDLQFNRAISLLHYGAPDKAAAIFNELFPRWPNKPSAGLMLSHAWLASGKISEARVLLQNLKQEFPNSAEIELMLGSLFLIEDKMDEAFAHFENVEKLAPNLPQLQVPLAQAYLRNRRWKEARDTFERALQIDSDNAEACYGLSVALLRLNRLEDSCEFALRAVGLLHHFPEAHFQLGAVMARLNQPERAALAFETGLAMKPGVVVAHRYLARLYYRLGNFRKCHEHHEAISRFKDNVRSPAKSV